MDRGLGGEPSLSSETTSSQISPTVLHKSPTANWRGSCPNSSSQAPRLLKFRSTPRTVSHPAFPTSPPTNGHSPVKGTDGSAGSFQYDVVIGNTTRQISVHFICNDLLKNSVTAGSPTPSLFDIQTSSYSQADHPLRGALYPLSINFLYSRELTFSTHLIQSP